MQNLRRLGGGAGILAGIAAAWHLFGAAVLIPQAHLSLTAQESPHKYLVWANKHQEMLWWINGGSMLAPLLGLVLLLALADRVREDAPDRSQIGYVLGVVGLIGFAVGAFLKQFGLGSLVPFHVTNKVGAAIAFYAVNGTANAFLSLGGVALGFGALAFGSVMLKMRGYYGQAGSLSIIAGAGLILSAFSPHGSFYIITSLLTIAWLAGTGAVLWMETAPGHARRGHVGEIRDESVMVMSRGAGSGAVRS
ncbi:MAG: hypothetical protein E6H04_10585 [Bacillati bacterium ANGP1]|uniref:DUF998 domain-containing protein n=1 Tax=Candidatus Segetimicrobium genomatis TaxID=2569760 RepID=A0A537J7B1_9BACT|nr:MAG: hypothetical protein E6H04_10585 [Terrabacteria group bacterium ANGP1]